MKISLKIITGYAVLFCLPVLGGESVDYTVNGEQFEGYMEKGSADAPLVLLFHDWDGLTDYEVKRAGMLAGQGYSVFCADLYGKGVRPTEMADRRKCMQILTDDRPRMRTLMKGALETAKAQGLNTENCVAMGYCLGGRAVLELARAGEELKGFVTFHGGLDLPEGQDYSSTKGKVLILHGSADTGVTIDKFAALIGDLEKAGVPHECISYGGAPHAWTVFGSDRYREEADRKSWQRFLEFLGEIQ